MDFSFLTEVFNNFSGVLAATALAAASAQAVIWMSTYTTDKPIKYPVSLDDQSVEIQPGVRASRLASDGKLIEYYHEDAKTTHEALVRGIRVSNNGPCLGTRKPGFKEYEWISYQELYDRAQMIGSAFLQQGLKPADSTCIGIYSPNCLEWVISEEACSMFSMAVVPLYDTLGSEACEYIINQTEMKLVICDTGSKANLLLKAKDRMASLRTLVVIQANTLNEEVVEGGHCVGVDVLNFTEMMEIGRTKIKAPVPPLPESICTICYTSGTTGNPKGVIVTHKAMMANISAAIHFVHTLFQLSSEDVHLAYLPLAHMFERLNQLLMLQHGGRIGFSSGDIRLLLEDLAVLRPTLFFTVPRLLNRIYDKVLQGISGSYLKSVLLRLAINRKILLLKRGIITRSSIWDYLVFNRIQDLLGSRVRACVVGSAPLSEDVLNFTRCAFGCYVFEGYGQTEVTAAATMTLPLEWQAGVVGPPLTSAHIKLDDVPEMEYFATNNVGEICIRSSSAMLGYFKDPEKTKEAVDDQGWVHTGDIGQWMPNGVLKVIDRRKHIFKLAQGEYIAPEKIESIYGRSRFIAQIFVDGDSFRTYPVAIIVPDFEILHDWARKDAGIQGSPEELCHLQVVKNVVLEDIAKIGKDAGLKGFEQVKEICLCCQPFTVDNGLLTPTLKSRRPNLRKRFAAEIRSMYNRTE